MPTPTISERIESATISIEGDASKLKSIVNSAATAPDVVTGSGPIKPIAKVVKEGQEQLSAAVGSMSQAVSDSAANAATASTKAGQAATSATNAANSASAASTSASNAATSATNSANSATASASSATAAAGSATSAKTAATNAASSASGAAGSASTASTQASNASTSAGQAATSASNAATSASTASTKASEAVATLTSVTTKAAEAAASASAAAGSASAAVSSASSASTSASTASTKAGDATTQAGNAASSASAAATSATQAASSATAAAGSVTSAATQVNLATTQATNAAASATSASNSATTATTKANEASASATAASGSASTAITQAANASASAVAAGNSATNAATSASQASSSKDTAVAAATSAQNSANVVSSAIAAHVALSNPHTQYQLLSEKGANNGYASLDSSGKVPSSQLPSYVDDVMEYANLAAFPGTGETGKIYVALDTGKTYRWTGSVYTWINASAGTADTAIKLLTARTLSITGDGAWSTTFDGSGNVTGALTLSTSGVVAGTYLGLTINANGRVTAANPPSTLSGFGIGDAYTKTQVDSALGLKASLTGATFTGAVNLTSATASGEITGNVLKANTNVDANGLYVGGSDIYQSTTNGESGVSFNYVGYQGGTTQFRNFFIYDGKNNLLLRIKGSDTGTVFFSTLDATSPTSGSVAIAGGLGVAKSVWSGSSFVVKHTSNATNNNVLSGNDAAGNGLTLRKTSVAVGSVPSNVWQWRMGGSAALPIWFTGYDNAGAFIIQTDGTPVRTHAAGNYALMSFNTGTTQRWALGREAGTETGTGNAGSNFRIYRYDDAGVALGYPIEINRASGTVFLNNILASNHGTIKVGSGAQSNCNLALDAAASNFRNLLYQTGGVNRWAVQADSATETGTGNTGSDFCVTRFSDAGAALGIALYIERSTGKLTLGGVLASDTDNSYPGSLTATGYRHYANSTNGSVIYGFGSSYDVLLANRAGSAALRIPANTQNVEFLGKVIIPTTTPASSSAAGTVGTMTWDASYVYVCTAANTWKRAALSSW